MLHGSCPWAGWQPTTRAQQQIGQATMNVFSWLDSGTGIQARTTGEEGLAEFREQREGVLRPLSGMPPLEPPYEG